MIDDVFVEQARGFHVVNDRCAGIARQHVTGEKHHLPIRKNHLTGLRDDTQAVTVTIKREADFHVGRFDDVNQLLKIFQLRWIGMMVRKIAVDFAIHLDHITAHRAENFRCQFARRAVAAINGDLHRARHFCVAHDAVKVCVFHVNRAVDSLTLEYVTRLGACFEGKDGVAPNRLARDHHFDAVVVRGVVAAGDADAGAGAERVTGEIGDRRRYQTEINRVTAGGYDTVAQGL